MALQGKYSTDILLRRLVAFIRLGRYLFLAGGFVFYGLGAAVALYLGVPINLKTYLWGQAIVTATQLMVHYSNDYFDLDSDGLNIAPTAWSGGSRVLLENLFSPRVALITALALGTSALVLLITLVIVEHPSPAVPILAVSALILSWSYSAPPVRLHSRGIGEITATLIVAVLTPLLAFALQAGRVALLPILAVLPLLFLQFNMLLSVALADVESDSLAGKRTLAVRLGRSGSARLYVAGLAAAYLLVPLVMLLGLPAPVAGAFSLSLLLAAPLALWTAHGAWARPERGATFAFCSIALLISGATLELITFLAMSIRP
ncbi:MAG TPA: prenyltransferase [Aggregatilineales bacterium]|nr:prenyltransferase [Aggregatilineales bacterium]